MRQLVALRLASVALLALVCPGIFPGTAVAADPSDITADVLADRDVTLSSDAIITLPSGTTTYTGVFSGVGTLTVAGTGTLILTKDSDFTLPVTSQRQKLVTTGGNHPVTRIEDADPPAVTVERGATLQYGTGSGTTGVIGHYQQVPGLAWNTLNHRVDGTLDLAVGRLVHPGIISGTGLVTARRFLWPGISLAGDHPFTGVLFNGTGVAYGESDYPAALSKARAVINQGSFICYAPTNTTVSLAADLYSRNYGNDVNFHTMPGGLVVASGVYSWSDNSSMTAPALSKPALNYADVPHRDNKRGINIEGADVQWGDGTNHRFFLPGNRNTVYINLHASNRGRGRLTFDYNGPVTLSAPISGGLYHDTLSKPGAGDVVIKGTRGNAVTFAAAQNYDGSTSIGKHATLRLGTGRKGQDGSLRAGGLARIVDQGNLVVQNAATPLSLTRISGTGSLTQAGTATTTLAGAISYRGATTVRAGTLAVRGASLGKSSGVSLKSATARLDLSRAGAQSLRRLDGVAGSRLKLGTGRVTVGGTGSSAFAGHITGRTGQLRKTGTGTLTLTGQTRIGGGRLEVKRGGLRLGTGADVVTGAFTQTDLATLIFVEPPATANPARPRLRVTGKVSLDGKLTIQDDGGTGPGQRVTLLQNTGSQPVSGTFKGLPEGAGLTVADSTYRISYRGGDGNDVTLTRTGTAAAAPVAAASQDRTTLTAAGVKGGGGTRSRGGAAILGGTAIAAALALGARRVAGRRRPAPAETEPTSERDSAPSKSILSETILTLGTPPPHPGHPRHP